MATPPKTRRAASAVPPATPAANEAAPVKKPARKAAAKAAAPAPAKAVEKKPATKKAAVNTAKKADPAAESAAEPVGPKARTAAAKKAIKPPVVAKTVAPQKAPATKLAAKKATPKKTETVVEPADKPAAKKPVTKKPVAKKAAAKQLITEPTQLVEKPVPAPKQPKAAAKKTSRLAKPAAARNAELIAVQEEAPAPVIVPTPPLRFALHREGPWFGRAHQVELLATGQRWQVLLRGAGVSAAACSCEHYAERGACAHLDFALAALQDDAEGQAALAQGWQTEHSELWLQYGLRRQLGWHAGRACPAALRQAAEALLALPQDSQGDALPALLALAAQYGHELRVPDAVWAQLAEGRDARQRVLRLSEVYAEGMASPALRGLLKLPLPRHQLEAALFAACAGRSLVADDLQLGLQAVGLATAELLQRHFAVERVLLLCAESAQTRWLADAQSLTTRRAALVWGDAAQRAQQWQGEAEIKIAALGALEQDLAPLQGWAPDCIIIDEAQRLGEAALARLRTLTPAFLLLLSSQLPQAQPAVLLRLVELLDVQRSGALAALHERHLRFASDGQLLPLAAPGRLAQSLERLMLSRAGSELALPPALVQLRAQPLTAQQLALQAPLLEQLRRRIARWQRSAYLADAEQLQLVRELQALRRLGLSPALLEGGAEGPAPRLEAVAALARELLAGAVDKLVVCCQWDDALGLLAQRLLAAGLKTEHLPVGTSLAERRTLAARWRDDQHCPLLLCSDAAGSGVDLRAPGVGLISLELPWGDVLLEQRLGRVADDETHGLPLLQLLSQGGIESAMLALQDSWPELPACSLDGDASLQLLSGTALTEFMQALVGLLALVD
jgi:hypothetical protein